MYLVTGGAGFIGSNLVAALCERGAEVLVCDRLRGGEPGREKWRNLAHHPIAGILPPEKLWDWLEDAPRPEAIFHLGAISDTTVRDGDLVAENNLSLTLRLYAWCAEHGVRLIYASSAATYGDGALGFDDDASPAALAALRPLNLYGWSKHATDRRIADLLARGRAAPPQWAGLKFFNVYGPNEFHKGRMASVALHKFRQIMAGTPATLFRSDREGIADGEQLRDFVHVDDCVEVMLWLLDNPQASGLFNVGTGTARSFLDLTRAVYAALGKTPEIAFIEMPVDLAGKYQYFTQARMERLRAAGFTGAATSLEDGVRRYVQDFLTRPDPYR
ncbi:ADP-glyceromanno-heptose 6-epimerase [Pseudoroseomonas rhizosphaerae]|uniref:ADP-L-glycero-D-manno-heptose-6-epimerase n=1 Tax=Teichococcus rhizosphaerae TaxID=1335062 RepID=A0A2C7A4G6_9PROT|nr:ADP-glyceromanno-heptose 6-epimerase [Pseudoroseomonas rhizosphaerae]PHK94958.1 ADP-glyceromanno-heptose 6-epimerase [Pseudoroseomonas rhizosphaerae]